MKRFGWSGKEKDKEPPASEEKQTAPAVAGDESSDPSNHSAAGDTVPQLPNISRNSIASVRSSAGPNTGPNTPRRNSTGIGSEPNGSAPPTLVKPSAEVQVLSDKNWTKDEDLENARGNLHQQNITLRETCWLAFKGLGIVYGDIGTSPLYVFQNIFLEVQPSKNDVLGATSLVLWTIVLIVLIKYSLVVLLADDNGEGGTFALYSIICRYAKIGTPNSRFQPSDSILQRYSTNNTLIRSRSHNERNKNNWLVSLLQNSKVSRMLLLFIVLCATAMVMGDGILTPAQSVLSAISGLSAKNATHNVHLSSGVVVGISCAVLVFLYTFQWIGTNYLGWLFSPIVVAWLLFNTIIGIYNIAHWHPAVFSAVSPHWAFKFLIDHGHNGWVMLGGVLLCVTGAEAMYADLGHFTRVSIQAGLYTCLLPSLFFTYLGQAAYLIRFPDGVQSVYYNSLPNPVYWPMFVIATLASIVASQAMITAAFSIVRQSMSLGCFPRLQIIQTNARIRGQIYIPEINYALMVLSIAAVGGFQTLDKIGSAYGVAVTFVFFITDCLFAIVMMVAWELPWWFALAFFIFFGALDGVFLSATLNKFTHGGWFPIAVAVGIFAISSIWYWGQSRKAKFMSGNMVPLSEILENKPASDSQKLSRMSVTSADQRAGVQDDVISLRRASVTGVKDTVARIPGIGLMHADTIFGVPPVFTHLLTNLPAIYKIVVFVTVREVPVPRVEQEERYLITELDYNGFYRCVCRYGYMECVDLGQAFEDHMVAAMNRLTAPKSEWPGFKEALRHQVARQKVEAAQQNKVVYIMGRVDLTASSNINFFKRLVLEYFYNPMERNCRTQTDSWNIPRSRLIEVGMSYDL